MADKIKENGTNPQDQKKQSIDAIFKSAHDYLSNLEKSMGELLKKFHLNNETFDGDLDGKGTTKNKIDELYKNKVLKLKEELDSNKSQLNKQAIISKVIAMSMEARGITSSALSKEAKEKLQGTDLAEFEKEKNELIRKNNTEEFKKLGDELLNAGKALDSLEVKSVESKGETVKEVLKKEAVSLLEKRAKNEITQEVFEEKMEKTMNEADKFNIEREVSEAFGNKIKEIDLSQAKKVGERSMVSGVLPLALIMTPQLRKVVPILPSVIGLGIWARIINGSPSEKAMAVGETILYIAPITGTAMSAKDTWQALQKYLAGNGEMGDVIANGTGTVISAGFDVATIVLALSGVGAPAAVGSNALKISAVESAKYGIKKVVAVFTKEAVEKGTSEGFTITLKEFVKGKGEFISSAVKDLGVGGSIGKVSLQIAKETKDGFINIMTLNAKGFKEMFAKKTLDKDKVALTLREINHESRSDTETSALKNEENTNTYVENLSSKNIDGILTEVKETINQNKNSEELKDIMNILKTQDEHMGNSMNILLQLSNSINKYTEIRNSTKKTGDINALVNIINQIDSTIKANEGKISKGLYEYLERVISKMKKGEDFSETSGNYKLIQNKIHGLRVNETFINDKQLNEYRKLLENGENQSINGYMGNYMKTLNELNNIDFTKLKGEKADIFIDNLLDIVKNAEHNGNGAVRVEYLKAAEKGENSISLGKETGYENIIEKLLTNPKTAHIRDIIIKHTDLSLITKNDLKEKIVKEGFENISKMNPKDAINQLKHLSYYNDYKNILKEVVIKGNGTTDFVKNYGVIKKLAESTNSNKDLLVLLDFAKNDSKLIGLSKRNKEEKNLSDYAYLEKRIIGNISNNTQINEFVGLNSKEIKTILEDRLKTINLEKEYKKEIREEKKDIIKKLKDIRDNKEITITKEELNNLFLDVAKLGDENYNIIMETIISKTNTDITKLIESHEIVAKMFKLNPKKFEDFVIKEISGNNTSIEYKIKLIEELEKNGISMKESYERLNKYLIDAAEINFVNKLDYFENFYKNSEYYKNNKNKFLEWKIEGFKEYKHYKDLSKNINEKLIMLVDTDRSFSDRFIKDLKNSGDISHFTLNKIDEIIKAKVIKTSNGEIIKNLSETDIKKLERVKEQVKTALGKYEFNLFDDISYKDSSNKGDYIFNVIDQMSGWKLTKGVDNPKELNRTIVKQLNVLKNNFNISPEVIDNFLYKVLGNKENGSLNVEEKINLLKLLEKTGVIKPSVEHKLEYIIELDAKASDLRADISHIKSYAKNFEQGLQGTNMKIKELKEKGDKNGIKELVEKTINERVPVEESYLDGKELKEGLDYVIIKDTNGKDNIYITEIFPSRYFITKMLETKDIRQKESYMELIHNKKEFGDQSIKDYFNSTDDIHSKILLSYHDELKYDPEVIKFLQEAVKTNQKEVAYAMSKRRDFDVISSEKGKINDALLDKMLTREYIEKKLGKDINNETYEKYKDGIKKMILFADNKEFRNLVIGIRTLDDLDENKMHEISSELKKAGIAIDESLLASKEFLMMTIAVRSSDRDKKSNILDDFKEGEKGIKSILNDSDLLSTIYTIRLERDEEYKNYDRIADLENGLKNRKKGNILHNIGTQSRGGKELIEEVNNNKSSETPMKFPFIGEMTPKKAIILAVSLGYMTRQEAEANRATWQKIDNLEAEGKMEEAKKLKAEAITEITKLYISQFPKEELGIKSVEKIGEIDKQLQEILFKCFDLGLEKIPDEKVRKQFTLRITNFFQGVNKNSGGLVEFAQKNLETLPGFAGSSLYNTLYSFAKESDDYIAGEINKEIKGQNDRNKKLDEEKRQKDLRKKLLGNLRDLKS